MPIDWTNPIPRPRERPPAKPAPLSDVEEEVLGAIDQGWLVDRVRELVSFPSFNGDESEAQEYLARLLSDAGFSVDIWEIDENELRRHPAYASEVERARPLGVVGRVEGDEEGPTLVFNGHVDVVPPGDPTRWTTAPFSCVEREGRLFGRGVLDMKGPLIAALAGLRAAIPRAFPRRGSVVFQSVIGEEDGGLGTLASVLRGYTGDGAVVLEPTDLSVASAQAGALNFRLSVPGKAAHGALRHEGVSAIENFIELYRALMKSEEERNGGLDDPRFSHLPAPYPICIGRIQGGDWASSVPDSVNAEGRFGVPLSESVDVARRVLEDTVARACLEHGWLRHQPAELSWWGGQFAPCETGPESPVVRTALEVGATLGVGSPLPMGVPYGSDLRLLVNEGGTPGVLFGPGDIAHAHRPNESISIAELMDGARAAALMAMRFLSGPSD